MKVKDESFSTRTGQRALHKFGLFKTGLFRLTSVWDWTLILTLVWN